MVFAVVGVVLLWIDVPRGFADREPYEAPPYVAPPPPQSRLHLLDNGDGTLTDPDSKLMWAKADSYSTLRKCLNWYDSEEYVKNLRVAGFADWRMPTINELAGIYDNTKENVMSWDHDPIHPMALDEKFADGAAYWYWSSEKEITTLTDCCVLSFYFVKGMVHIRQFGMCANGGVRAVRNIR